MRSKRKKASLLLLITGFFINSLLVILTNPLNGGPIVVLAFLTGTFLFFMGLMLLVMTYVVETHFKGIIVTKQAAFYSSISLATGAVFLIGLQTIGQLQIIDVFLVVAFELLVNFYVYRRL